MGRGRGTSGQTLTGKLTGSLKSGIGLREKKPTSKKKDQSAGSLIPLGKKYMENGFNVLLIGGHGTGKTASVLDIAKELGYNVKMFSGATMDPYTDLVGVPVPAEDEDGAHLNMVRPRDLDEAEIIFFDEINRAPSATQNAVFEIIQFGTINGEPLPKLKACWAAMNPDNGDYDVEALDPALIDRFDAYQELKPSPSVAYMANKMPKPIAQALVAWWRDQNKEKRGIESYISPRRLEKIGILFDTIGTQAAVKQALPPGGTYDSKKLILMLEAARDGKKIEDPSKLVSDRATGSLEPDKLKRPVVLKRKKDVIKHIKDNPGDTKFQEKILSLLETGVGAEKFVNDYGEIINEMPAAVVESWAKKSFIRRSYSKNSAGERQKASKIQDLLMRGTSGGYGYRSSASQCKLPDDVRKQLCKTLTGYNAY